MRVELMPLIQRAARFGLVRQGAQSRQVQVGGLGVHLMDLPGTGTAPPVVLVHGLGSNALTFSRIMPGLARHSRRVLAADLPGSGFSPMPERPVSLEQAVSLLAELYARELGPEGGVFVGNSLGGAMTFNLASERPELVRALALVAPAGARLAPERFRMLVDSFRMETWEHGRDFLRRLYHRAPPLVPELLASDMLANFNQPNVKEYLLGDRPSDYVEEHRLAGLKMPVLLLWGRSEKVLPYEGIHYFREHLPDHAEIEEVEGFGHTPHLDASEALVARLGRFLDELPGKLSQAALPPGFPRVTS